MNKTAISAELAAGLATSALGAGIGAYTADTSSDKTTAEKLKHRLRNAGIGLAAGGLAGYGLSQLDSVKGLANSAKDQYSKAKGYYEKLKSDYPANKEKVIDYSDKLEEKVIDYGNKLRLPSEDWKRQVANKIYNITPQSSTEDKQKSYRLGNLMAIDPFRMNLNDSDPTPSNAFIAGLGGSALGAGIGAIATDTSSDKTILQKIKHRLRNAGLGFAAGGLAGYGLTSGAESLGLIQNPRVNPLIPTTPTTTTTTAKQPTKKQVMDRLVKEELNSNFLGDTEVPATKKQIAQATQNVNERLLNPTSLDDTKNLEEVTNATANDKKKSEEFVKLLNPLDNSVAGAAAGVGYGALTTRADPNAKPFVSNLDQISKQLETVRASVENLPPSVPATPASTALHDTLTTSHFNNPYTNAPIDPSSPRISKEDLRDWLIKNQNIDVAAYERITGRSVKPWSNIMNPKARAEAEAKFWDSSSKLRNSLSTAMAKLPDPVLYADPITTQVGREFGPTVDEFGNPVSKLLSREQALIDIDRAKAQLHTGVATPEEISRRLGIKPEPKTFGERAAVGRRGLGIAGRLGALGYLGSLLPEIPKLFRSVKER